MLREATYDTKPVRTPILRGMALRLVVTLLENPVAGPLLAPLLRRDLGVGELRTAEMQVLPTFLPLHPGATAAAAPAVIQAAPQASRGPGLPCRRIADYQSAYRSGAVTPEQVAERVVAGITASDRLPLPIRAFIACDCEDVFRQAREAARRHKEGRHLGPLDGVPIAIKDEIDAAPYPTTAGTRFLGGRGAQADSTVAARLRSAGAVLIGKTNMHEIGILPDSQNPHYGPVRNTHNPAHEAGGSSSGSAAAVAMGICPAAIGSDGGGSIRIPAAFCGVLGLKPTFGRVSEFGAVPLAWSVGHLGPIAATAEDAALVYAAIAGPDPADPYTHGQPPIENAAYEGRLSGVRIGVYREWFSDAAADTVATCEQVLDHFVRLGARLVDVIIPDLRLIAIAHALTIHAEMAANMNRHDRPHRRDFGWTTRLMLANVRSMRSSDYVQAQRIRTLAIDHFRQALSQADVIATPAVPVTAPLISEYAAADGEVNIGQVLEIMRFANPANFTGLPAISIPAGYDRRGLPVGLQLVARPWDEAALLLLAFAAEGIVARRKPAVYFDPVPEADESV
jgi:Asp-tRNA(Asn)/Glu-tRNA(Gln) amidotransferase A subunit family amidase